MFHIILFHISGDLSDDLILINELENIRHVPSNNVNNKPLGENYSLRLYLNLIELDRC